jgi:hypothetical protein
MLWSVSPFGARWRDVEQHEVRRRCLEHRWQRMYGVTDGALVGRNCKRCHRAQSWVGEDPGVDLPVERENETSLEGLFVDERVELSPPQRYARRVPSPYRAGWNRKRSI